MRIATWNVNGLRARLEFVLHWLRARQPDVVGMQETKASDDDFPHEELAELGYKVLNHGQKGWNGVAIVSREDAELTTAGLPGRDDDGARLLRARVGSIDFTTVYCPNGKTLEHADFPMKLDWFLSLSEFLDGGVGADSVLCGDFNIVPEPADCWRGEAADGTIFCTEEERARYSALLELGFTDLYRQLHPDTQAFSWWDYRGGAFHRGMGLRIDMLLGGANVAGRVTHVEIDREY
ncbi:MAG: exodeoxyribonuclease III, partial [Gammaproteobacteria bacterium]|nr:exodeoxyribonuclease III [Gammaproteobacteria bacterium]